MHSLTFNSFHCARDSLRLLNQHRRPRFLLAQLASIIINAAFSIWGKTKRTCSLGESGNGEGKLLRPPDRDNVTLPLEVSLLQVGSKFSAQLKLS